MTRPAARDLVAPLAVVGAWVVLGTVNPFFLSVSNGLNIAGQVAPLALAALGQMLVIVTRGFDISVGSVAALATVAGALAAGQAGWPGLLAVPAVGLACGAVNGLLVGYLGIQPIIATLGMLLFARGAALLLSDGNQAVMLPPDMPLMDVTYGEVLGVPATALIVLAVTAGLAAALARLRLGRRLYMVGSDPRAAELVGVPVRRTLAAAYALCGLAASLAGLVFLGRAGAGLPTEGSGLELSAIAAAVIGGTALSGGTGSPFPVLAGAFFVQSLLNGLNLMGISPFVAEVVLGLVIVLAGALDFVLRR
ncbi:MAG TPA: ABC transporter permease, partial [Thermodesulfobacteriota bacterium]